MLYMMMSTSGLIFSLIFLEEHPHPSRQSETYAPPYTFSFSFTTHTHTHTHTRPVARGGVKGAYAPPPFARDACRRPSTQPARACTRGRTLDSHAFFFSAQLTSAVCAGQRGHAGSSSEKSPEKKTRGIYMPSLGSVYSSEEKPEYYRHCHYHPLRSFYYPLNIQCS